jgi:hypothetical protein
MRTPIAAAVLLAALIVPTSAAADVQTFHSFDAEATAFYTLTEQCDDGSTAVSRVRVAAGEEEESENGVTTFENEFLFVQIQSFDCDGEFTSERFQGPADFTFSPSLQDASVTGTVTRADGRTVTVDMTWQGTGPLESSSNTTTFPGFTGHFKNKRRDAVATGTVVLDGETLVDGSTADAQIETFEDNNTSRS